MPIMPDLNTTIEFILTREEAYRAFIYDDRTGSPVVPGYTLIGHPTLGYGHACDVHPIGFPTAMALLRDDYGPIPQRLTDALEWFSGISVERQAVFVCLAFQIGVAGFLKFTETAHAASVGDWSGCATAMLDSQWAKVDSPARAARMAAIIRTGIIPTA